MLTSNSSEVTAAAAASCSVLPSAATPDAVMACVAFVFRVVVGPANTNAVLFAGMVWMNPDQVPIVTRPTAPVAPTGPAGPAGPAGPGGPACPATPAGPVGPAVPASC